MKKSILLLSLSLCFGFFSSVLRAELPEWYPNSYHLVGFIGLMEQNNVFIDDIPLLLSPTAKLATATARNANIRQLKVGQLVGVRIVRINNRALIDAIWLIPENEYKQFRPLK